MTAELEAEVAIVTGGGRGFGRVIATGLAAAGAAVTVTARTASELAETVARIEDAGGRGLAVVADVTLAPDWTRVLRETESRFGPVTLLVSNAAVSEPAGPVWENDPDIWQRTLEVNLMGAVRGSRAVLPAMIERRRGRIIIVSSAAALSGRPYDSAYRVAKTAQLRLAEVMAMEARPFGVSVFAIHPGIAETRNHESRTMTEAGRRWLPGFADQARRHATRMELAAECCVFLASGAADGLSGRYISATVDYVALARRAAEVRRDDLQVLRLTVGGGLASRWGRACRRLLRRVAALWR